MLADDECLTLCWCQNRDTALHIAAALKRSKIAKLLVDAGVDIHILNRVGFTFLCIAALCCFIKHYCVLLCCYSDCVQWSHTVCWATRKGIKHVKDWVLVCWWWQFDWSFAHLTAPFVTTTSVIIGPKIQECKHSGTTSTTTTDAVCLSLSPTLTSGMSAAWAS